MLLISFILGILLAQQALIFQNIIFDINTPEANNMVCKVS